MASALRELLISFGSEFDPKGMQQGEASIKGMISKLAGFATAVAGAFAVKEVFGFTMGLAEQAVELKHHAEALGISAQSLQQWDYAASLSGVSTEELQIGLQKLQRSAVGAGGSGGELAAVFKKLNVQVKNSNGTYKNADELLTDVAGAIGDMTDPTLQTATAMQIFGRGGARLLPFLKQGRAGVAALKEEVAKLGGGFTDDFIDKSEAMVQDSKRLEFAFLGLKVNAIGPLLPALTSLAEGATKFVVAGGEVLKKSNAAKAALIALGIGGAAALAPLVLSVAPIVAGFLALEDVLTFLTGGDSLTGDLLDKFFGSGAAKKVKAFTDEIANELGPVLKAAMEIFTDGKPLDVKFQELHDFIETKLGPDTKATFHEMVDDIKLAVDVVTELVAIVKDLIKVLALVPVTAFKIGSAVNNSQAAGAIRSAADQEDKDSSAREASGQSTWFDSLRNLLVPSSAVIGKRLSDAGVDASGRSWVHPDTQPKAPALSPDDVKALVAGAFATAPNVATAPIAGGQGGKTEIKNTYTTPITQKFYGIDSAEDAGKAASDGVKSALSSVGERDRTMRALTPSSSG